MNKIILFENILNDVAFTAIEQLRKETKAVMNHVFGDSEFVVETCNKEEKLQEWCNTELYKSISCGYCSVYPVKTKFNDVKDDDVDEEYGGSLKMWIFEPDGALDDQVVVITCEFNGLFRNNTYVVGVIGSTYDLENIIGGL